MFFSNTNRTNLTNCLGYDPVYIRGIREIRGHLNIIHTLICFSNTNRTNRTNCLGYDPVYIRGIREIRGHLNIIHTRICFSNTNRTNLTNLVGRDMVYIRGIREIRGQEPAASGNACKSVYNLYASKEKVKKIRQRLRVHRCNP